MTASQSGAPSPRLMLRGLGWDVGLPVLGYYALHLAGVNDFIALLVASLLAAARIGWVAVRERELNPFATVMLVVFGIGLILAFASGDPRFLLLKNSVVTGVLGLVFLGTTLFGTPLTLAASQSFQPARKAELRDEYDTDPHVRRGHRLSSIVGSGPPRRGADPGPAGVPAADRRDGRAGRGDDDRRDRRAARVEHLVRQAGDGPGIRHIARQLRVSSTTTVSRTAKPKRS